MVIEFESKIRDLAVGPGERFEIEKFESERSENQ
jgi:hypothetical protein